MKQPQKSFDISHGRRPKVLLLGNGICRAFGGFSWNAFLDEIKDKKLPGLSADKYLLPMPLKAVLLSNNRLAEKMRSLITARENSVNTDKHFHWDDFVRCPDEMKALMSKLLNLDFDYILTTNYSYEIEAALMDSPNISAGQISKLMNTIEVACPQTQYLLNTFNMVENGEREYHIWHIHGEARKPNSMIIGHNYYARNLSRIVDRLTKDGKIKQFKNNIKKSKEIQIGSWVDAFILGDVYILGFGLDFSEIDLWWLLDQKRLLSATSGKTVFFEKTMLEKREKTNNKKCPSSNELSCDKLQEYITDDECKKMLMTAYGIEIIEIPSNDYKAFYEEAVNRLSNGERR